VPIGSNTKDFTIVALMRLERQGRLALRDSLATYFPDAPADKRGITLQQLVDHTGGFPIGIGPDAEALGRDAFVGRATRTQLRAAPGTREVYSNTGYALLAAVLEKVSGKSYERLVADEILAPLGLRETGYLLPRFDATRLSRGYEGGTDRGHALEKPHAADGNHWNLRGNGGFQSTVDEMHAFYRALFTTERLLPRAGRGDRFDPDGPTALAGSDLVHFFLYERFPRMGVELIVATNDPAHPAPAVSRALAPLLGLPTQRELAGGAAPSGPPPGARPPEPAVDSLVRAFTAVVNASDSAATVRFVAASFAPDTLVSPEQRIARMLGMRARLGQLEIGSIWMAEPDVAHATVRTSQGPGTLIFNLVIGVPGTRPRIGGLGLMIGG
jgi:hypothetical protein